MEKDLFFMQKAYEQAKLAQIIDEVPIGCVIVKDDKIIAKGHNLKEKKKNAILHAEMLAINKASKKLKRWRLSDCDLYVTLEPCPMCMGAIIGARFQRVIFGAFDPKAGACGSLYDLNEGKLNHKVALKSGVMQDECSSILSDYFAAKRKKRKENKVEK